MHYLHLNRQPFSGMERRGEAREEGEGAYRRKQEKPFSTTSQPSWLGDDQKEVVRGIPFLSSKLIHYLGFARAKLLFSWGRCFVKVALVPTGTVWYPVLSVPRQGSERSLWLSAGLGFLPPSLSQNLWHGTQSPVCSQYFSLELIVLLRFALEVFSLCCIERCLRVL